MTRATKKAISAQPTLPTALPTVGDLLLAMGTEYRADPMQAVRSQSFIKNLHKYIADDLRSRLTDIAIKDGVEVKEEVTIFGSHKPKDADVALVHPNNGPLMYVGVRSQMSSVGKNVLTYYQDIIGECISLQERFPMAAFGYVYLHPLLSKKTGSKTVNGVKTKTITDEHPDHPRYARLYDAIAGRDEKLFKQLHGIYDQFAYMVVDFDKTPLPDVRDDIVQGAVPLTRKDLRISTFVDRMVATFKEREIWLDYFK